VLSLFVAIALTAGNTPDVAMGQFNFVEVSAEMREFIISHLAQRFESEGLSVITQRDVMAALGAERQRQLLGCNAESCTAELVAALGADSLAVGDVARVGGAIQVNLKVMSTHTLQTAAQASERVASERELLPALERVVHQVCLKLLATRRAAAAAAAPSTTASAVRAPMVVAPPPGLEAQAPQTPATETVEAGGLRRRTVGQVALGLGAAAAGTGAVLWLLAADDSSRLTRPSSPLDAERALALANQGANFQRAGVVLVAAGGAALLGGALLWLTDRSGPSLAFTPTTTGFAAALQGRF
jgi:hypothetical protein